MKKVLLFAAGLALSTISASHADYDRDFGPWNTEEDTVTVNPGERYSWDDYYGYVYDGRFSGRDYGYGSFSRGYYDWAWKKHWGTPRSKAEVVADVERLIQDQRDYVADMPEGRAKNYAMIDLRHMEMYLQDLKASDDKDAYFRFRLYEDAKQYASPKKKKGAKKEDKKDAKKDEKKADDKKDMKKEDKKDEKKEEKKPEEKK